MELTDSLASQAERQQLWNTLSNAENWKAVIPTSEKLTQTGENQYELVVKVDIGPIKGDQTVKINFTNLQSPDTISFELQHSLVKELGGTFNLKNPGETVEGIEAPDPLPEGTKTVLFYKLNADAGNPFVNAMLEGFKGQVRDGFKEILEKLDDKAKSA